MKVLSLVNNKGGVGKTTSTQNIGAALAKAGYRVLLIDLDAQASLTKCFGIRHEDLKFNSGSFILGECSDTDVVVNTTIETLHLMPATVNMTDKEKSINSDGYFPNNLEYALEKIQNKYDYVLVDCPPAMSDFTRIALVASDQYYIPLQAEFLSYEGLRNFFQFADKIKRANKKLQLGGVFATRYNPKIRKKLSNDLMDIAKEQLGDGMMDVFIRENIALAEAQARKINIFDHAPDSNGASDYFNLTKDIIKRSN